MKIKLELPDCIEKRDIYIFAGVEVIAKKIYGQPWQVKVKRCSYCGKCCMNVPDGWSTGKNKKTGHCAHLIFCANQWLCNLKSYRPFSCCVGDGEDDCSIKWKEIK